MPKSLAVNWREIGGLIPSGEWEIRLGAETTGRHISCPVLPTLLRHHQPGGFRSSPIQAGRLRRRDKRPQRPLGEVCRALHVLQVVPHATVTHPHTHAHSSPPGIKQFITPLYVSPAARDSTKIRVRAHLVPFLCQNSRARLEPNPAVLHRAWYRRQQASGRLPQWRGSTRPIHVNTMPDEVHRCACPWSQMPGSLVDQQHEACPGPPAVAFKDLANPCDSNPKSAPVGNASGEHHESTEYCFWSWTCCTFCFSSHMRQRRPRDNSPSSGLS